MPPRKPRDPGPPAYLRAAIAYADLRQEQVVEQLGVKESTLNRWLGGPNSKRDYKAPDDRQLAKLAEITRVPPAFLVHGFDADGSSAGDETREIRLERRISELAERAADLAGRVQRLERGVERLGSISERLGDEDIARIARQVDQQAGRRTGTTGRGRAS